MYKILLLTAQGQGKIAIGIIICIGLNSHPASNLCFANG